MLVLRTLEAADAPAFQRAYRATLATDPTFARGYTAGMTISEYLARLEDDALGRRLPEDHVPSTTYWGFIGAELVGRLMLRHRLNARRVLITCDEDNIASRRVIEKCGGILEGTSPIPETGVMQCRYWISLQR